jgi:hypothetical protein
MLTWEISVMTVAMKISFFSQLLVAQSYNPSYLGG